VVVVKKFIENSHHYFNKLRARQDLQQWLTLCTTW